MGVDGNAQKIITKSWKTETVNCFVARLDVVF